MRNVPPGPDFPPAHGNRPAAGTPRPVAAVEELAPVRPGAERAPARSSISGQQRLDLGLPLLPGEVQRDAVAAVDGLSHSSSRAIVRISDTRSTGASRRRARARPRTPRRRRGTGTKYSRLQLVADARGELQREVRQPLVPRPRHAELLGAVVGREPAACAGWRGPSAGTAPNSPARRRRGPTRLLSHAMVDASLTQFVNRLTLYAGVLDLVEVRGQRVPAAGRRRRPAGRRRSGTRSSVMRVTTPSAPRLDDQPGERPGRAPREGPQLAVRGDQLERRDGRRRAPAAAARSRGCRSRRCRRP